MREEHVDETGILEKQMQKEAAISHISFISHAIVFAQASLLRRDVRVSSSS